MMGQGGQEDSVQYLVVVFITLWVFALLSAFIFFYLLSFFLSLSFLSTVVVVHNEQGWQIQYGMVTDNTIQYTTPTCGAPIFVLTDRPRDFLQHGAAQGWARAPCLVRTVSIVLYGTVPYGKAD